MVAVVVVVVAVGESKALVLKALFTLTKSHKDFTVLDNQGCLYLRQ